MRKWFYTFFLLGISTLSIAKGGYLIKGTIIGLKDTSVYLGHYYGDKQYLKDTAKVDALGNFIFSGDEKLPGGIYLVVTPAKNYFELILDKEQNFSFEVENDNFIRTMKVKGSEENRLFYEYLNRAIQIQVTCDSLQKLIPAAKTKQDTLLIYTAIDAENHKLNVYRELFIKEHPESLLAKMFSMLPEPTAPAIKPAGIDTATWDYYYFKGHFLDYVDFKDPRLLRTPVFHGKLEKYITKIVVQDPDTINREADSIIKRTVGTEEMFKYVVWWITYHYETSNIMGLDAVYSHMVHTYYEKGLCPWTDSATLEKMVKKAYDIDSNIVGNKAPDLKMLSPYMQPIAMSEIKNKWLIVVFWDPDCGHCKEQIPKLDSMYHVLKLKYDVEVFAVNEGGNQQEWLDYIKEHNLEWINVWDPYNKTDYKRLYNAFLTPTLYLLNKDRKIVAKKIDYKQVGHILDDLSIKEKSEQLDKIK